VFILSLRYISPLTNPGSRTSVYCMLGHEDEKFLLRRHRRYIGDLEERRYQRVMRFPVHQTNDEP